MATYYLLLLLVFLGYESHALMPEYMSTTTTETASIKYFRQKSAQFRSDYVFISEYDSFYKYHYLKQNFTNAMLTCMEEGATLLVPTSKAEILQAVTQTSKSNSVLLWVGIHNLFHNEVFYTLEGDSLSEDFNLVVDIQGVQPYEYSNYQNYYQQETRTELKKYVQAYNENSKNVGNIANKTFDITYRTQPGNNKYQYICKKKAKTIVYNAECDNYDTSYVRADLTDSCYKLHTMHRNWSEAFRVCSMEQTKMVEINNVEEANFLVKELSKIPKNEQAPEFVHAGFSDLMVYGFFMTNSGKFLSDTGYEQWVRGHPTKVVNYGIGVGGSCGAFSIKGGLMTTNCQVKTKFFCEKKVNNKVQ